MNDEFKNGDINIDFTQLKLDDKGKDENVLFVWLPENMYCVRHGGTHL